jgi:DNA invertase Pin-like site-specific DNA recombinase
MSFERRFRDFWGEFGLRAAMPQKKSRRKATVKRVARVRRPAPKKPYTPSPRTDGEAHPNGVLIGYARVSTLDQSPTAQRDALNDAGCAKLFVEQMSGAIYDRPALKDMLELARAGDTIVVEARPPSPIDQAAYRNSRYLAVRNIGLRSLTESIDTTTPQGRLVFHMFAALAEFERSLIRERTQAGLAAARRAGRTGGRPAKLTDDDLDVATTLLANPDITVTEVAERVGVSPATLYRYLPAARTAHGPQQ